MLDWLAHEDCLREKLPGRSQEHLDEAIPGGKRVDTDSDIVPGRVQGNINLPWHAAWVLAYAADELGDNGRIEGAGSSAQSWL